MRESNCIAEYTKWYELYSEYIQTLCKNYMTKYINAMQNCEWYNKLYKYYANYINIVITIITKCNYSNYSCES